MARRRIKGVFFQEQGQRTQAEFDRMVEAATGFEGITVEELSVEVGQNFGVLTIINGVEQSAPNGIVKTAREVGMIAYQLTVMGEDQTGEDKMNDFTAQVDKLGELATLAAQVSETATE